MKVLHIITHALSHPENYEEQIQNRVFTFEGKGIAEIMIAVTDRHSVSSGIQFVPILGSPFKVNLIRGLSVMTDSVYMAFTFCILLFALNMFIRTRKAEIGFFFLFFNLSANFKSAVISSFVQSCRLIKSFIVLFLPKYRQALCKTRLCRPLL